jgi:hypothetical protein
VERSAVRRRREPEPEPELATVSEGSEPEPEPELEPELEMLGSGTALSGSPPGSPEAVRPAEGTPPPRDGNPQDIPSPEGTAKRTRTLAVNLPHFHSFDFHKEKTETSIHSLTEAHRNEL